jgi:hypothetical protein
MIPGVQRHPVRFESQFPPARRKLVLRAAGRSEAIDSGQKGSCMKPLLLADPVAQE